MSTFAMPSGLSALDEVADQPETVAAWARAAAMAWAFSTRRWRRKLASGHDEARRYLRETGCQREPRARLGAGVVEPPHLAGFSD